MEKKPKQDFPNYADFYNNQKFGYRHYQPLQPVTSRFLQLKWDSTNYFEHRQRVLTAKPTVNTWPPPTYGHVQIKYKKLMKEEERQNEIIRNNEILLDRMSNAIHKERRLPTIGNIKENNSSTYRRKCNEQANKIMNENLQILSRILTMTSNYDSKKWQKDWIQSRQLLKSIQLYQNQT